MTTRLRACLIAFLAVPWLASCNKPAPPPAPKPAEPAHTPAAGDDWPATPSGPLWEALGRLPAVSKGKIGVVDAAAAARPHEPYTESRHMRAVRDFDRIYAKRFGIKPGSVREIAWAELRFDAADGRIETVLAAHIDGGWDGVREAFKAEEYKRAEGKYETWQPGKEPEAYVPARIVLRDGWFLATNGGDAVVKSVMDAWDGATPSAQTIPHLARLVAGAPALVPAAVDFGKDDAPFPDSPLRVPAQCLVSDLAKGDDIMVVAFNDASGPDKMRQSPMWKDHMSRMKPEPAVTAQGPFLRLRLHLDADPDRPAMLRAMTEAALRNTLSALSRYEIDTAKFPESLKTLTESGEFGAYLEDEARDAWGRDLLYAVPGDGEKPFKLSSAGPDGVANTADDITVK